MDININFILKDIKLFFREELENLKINLPNKNFHSQLLFMMNNFFLNNVNIKIYEEYYMMIKEMILFIMYKQKIEHVKKYETFFVNFLDLFNLEIFIDHIIELPYEYLIFSNYLLFNLDKKIFTNKIEEVGNYLIVLKQKNPVHILPTNELLDFKHLLFTEKILCVLLCVKTNIYFEHLDNIFLNDVYNIYLKLAMKKFKHDVKIHKKIKKLLKNKPNLINHIKNKDQRKEIIINMFLLEMLYIDIVEKFEAFLYNNKYSILNINKHKIAKLLFYYKY